LCFQWQKTGSSGFYGTGVGGGVYKKDVSLVAIIMITIALNAGATLVLWMGDGIVLSVLSVMSEKGVVVATCKWFSCQAKKGPPPKKSISDLP
jgi:hypothetical protein